MTLQVVMGLAGAAIILNGLFSLLTGRWPRWAMPRRSAIFFTPTTSTGIRASGAFGVALGLAVIGLALTGRFT